MKNFFLKLVKLLVFKINIVFDESKDIQDRVSFFMKFSSILLLLIFYINVFPVLDNVPESTRTRILGLVATLLGVEEVPVDPQPTNSVPEKTESRVTVFDFDKDGNKITVSDRLVLNKLNGLDPRSRSEFLSELGISESR